MGTYIYVGFASSLEPLDIDVEYTADPQELMRRKHTTLIALLGPNEELVVVGKNMFWPLAPVVTEFSEFVEFETQRMNGEFVPVMYVKMHKDDVLKHRN